MCIFCFLSFSFCFFSFFSTFHVHSCFSLCVCGGFHKRIPFHSLFRRPKTLTLFFFGSDTKIKGFCGAYETKKIVIFKFCFFKPKKDRRKKDCFLWFKIICIRMKYMMIIIKVIIFTWFI